MAVLYFQQNVTSKSLVVFQITLGFKTSNLAHDF